jgi:hypothetical protein
MKSRYLIIAAVYLLCSSLHAQTALLNFSALKNPVFQHQGWSIKDSCMAHKDGTFYVFFSAFYKDDGMGRCHVSGVKTKDFKTFSDPLFIWDGRDQGWQGMCSPNISQIGDTYYLTYNSWGESKEKPPQLFYAQSKDLENWDKHRPLAANVTKGARSIDAAIAFANNKYYLVYKEYQTPKMAVGPSLDSDAWKSLGTIPGGWFENGEFIKIDGKWNLLVTDRYHLPCLRELKGQGDIDSEWINWGSFKRFPIPLENFNLNERANCAFLADFRSMDGYFYLLYSGRNKGFGHEGDFDFSLAIARSKDLITWQPPGK